MNPIAGPSNPSPPSICQFHPARLRSRIRDTFSAFLIRLRLLASTVALATLLTQGIAPALTMTVTWTGRGADSSWTTAGNWSTAAVPAAAKFHCRCSSAATRRGDCTISNSSRRLSIPSIC